MTIEEKARALKEYCSGMSSCFGCPVKHTLLNTCYEGYRKYPNEVERNYNIIFGSGETAEEDAVNHPSHYTAGGIECIDAICAAICKYENPTDAWLAGQVIKYLWRAPLKGKYNEDLKKAQFYLNRLVKGLEDKTNGQT